VATALGKRLQQVDPAHAAEYTKVQADFAQRWQQAIERWTAQGRATQGRAGGLAAQGLRLPLRLARSEGGRVLEPKPGIEPTASHLQEVL